MYDTRADFSQTGFHGGGFSTPQADEKKKGSKRSNNLVPVTVAQMFTAKHEDDVFISGNLELAQVTFIGLIKSVNSTPTRLDYFVDDMTGPPIEVRHFNDSDENEQSEDTTQNTLSVNTYVRICGMLRSFGGKRSVHAHKITPITDMNELSCHLLEVVYASASASLQQTSSIMGGGDNKGFSTNSSGMNQIAGLTPLQSQIQNIVRSNQSERGCSIDEICQQLKSVAPKAIRDTIDFLSSEGLIYSTIDEEHYQATDA
uniref:Replication protein A C-terminal domain-containing protein n=1 Tax=Biomphalaria glabrata TaxID=6526 RepID=A0A2C9LQQ6_BIOGL